MITQKTKRIKSYPLGWLAPWPRGRTAQLRMGVSRESADSMEKISMGLGRGVPKPY